jgi:hypothetical protein
MDTPGRPRRPLPVRFLAAVMDAMKRAADQTTRVPGQGTPGYPDWPEVPPHPTGRARPVAAPEPEPIPDDSGSDRPA